MYLDYIIPSALKSNPLAYFLAFGFYMSVLSGAFFFVRDIGFSLLKGVITSALAAITDFLCKFCEILFRLISLPLDLVDLLISRNSKQFAHRVQIIKLLSETSEEPNVRERSWTVLQSIHDLQSLKKAEEILFFQLADFTSPIVATDSLKKENKKNADSFFRSFSVL